LPLEEPPPPGPIFGSECVYVERDTELILSVNSWTDYITHTPSPAIPAGWYLAGYRAYIKLIDGYISDWGEARLLVDTTIIVDNECRFISDQGIDVEDPHIELAIFGHHNQAAPGTPTVRLQFQTNPGLSPLLITFGAIEMWRVPWP
jgi:hypothetical protein